MINALFSGFALGFSLILAIGAQNAFVIRQGLRNEHLLLVCLICSLSDASLILIGIFAFAQVAAKIPLILPYLKLGGAVYLSAYGFYMLYLAVKSNRALQASKIKLNGALKVALKCLAFTWLNPHVYLDTVILLGSVSASYIGAQQYFGLGAITASFCFFFSLGYLSRLLSPILSRPFAWRLLDIIIGLTMLVIAAQLYWAR